MGARRRGGFGTAGPWLSHFCLRRHKRAASSTCCMHLSFKSMLSPDANMEVAASQHPRMRPIVASSIAFLCAQAAERRSRSFTWLPSALRWISLIHAISSRLGTGAVVHQVRRAGKRRFKEHAFDLISRVLRLGFRKLLRRH